jgi:hypothetical protein
MNHSSPFRTVLIAGPLIVLSLVAMSRTAATVIMPRLTKIAAEQKQQPRILVAPLVVVSRANLARPHWEVQVAADPADATRLIACSMVLGDDQTYRKSWPTDIVVYTSLDGGLTWQPTHEIDKLQHNADPTCAFGPEGSAYLMSFGGNLGQRFHMPMYRSTDGAKTWQEVGEAESADREYVTIDDTAGKHRGRVYVHGVGYSTGSLGVAGIDGAQLVGLTISHSVDQGQSYKAVKLIEDGSRYILDNGNGIVMSDGTFATIFGDGADARTVGIMHDLHPLAPTAKLKFISSDDGGDTFTKASVVSDWYMRSNGTLKGSPSLTVDRTEGPFRDRLYAAWVDGRAGRGEIRLARSYDKGKTWLPSVVVSDNSAYDERGETPDAFMPMLAVNRNGVVGIMWYDRRGHADNYGYDIRFSASLDGGDSFEPSVLISPGGDSALDMNEWMLWPPWHLSAGPDGRQEAVFETALQVWTDNGGDTAGLACDLDGGFHPVWIDRRSGLSQVSTTRIVVNGSGLPNGGGGLELLSDWSTKAEIHYSMAHVDRTKKEITISASILNKSKEQIPGRLILRLLALSSCSGRIEVQNADNGVTTSGAVWEFRTPSGESLEPGALTVPRTLRFKLARAPLGPPRLLFDSQLNLLEMDTKVIGK